MQRPDRAMRSVMKEYGTKFVECYQGVWVFQLANGMKVILRKDVTTNSVVVNRVVKVGSSNEPRGFEGGAHYFEHLAFSDFGESRAAQGTSYDEIGNITGAVSNASTSRHGTDYWIKVSKPFLELALSIDSQRVRGIELSDKAVQSEKGVILNEMEQDRDRPGSVLYNQMFRHVFKKHPMRIEAIGKRKDVSNMTVKRLQWFYDKFYWPEIMTVIVTGDIEILNALELINRYYGSLASSPKPIPVIGVIEPKQTQERRFVIRKAGDLTYVMVGFRTPGAEDRDIPRLWVIEDLLGSPSGRLQKVLVDTNKAVSTSANVVLGRDYGLFLLGAVVAQGQSVDEVISIILAELEKLATSPVTEQELETVRKSAKSFNQRMWSDAKTWATGFIGATVEKADWKVAADSLKNCLSVTAKQIRQVAGFYFQSENRTIGLYIPTQKKARKNTVVDKSNAAIVPIVIPQPTKIEEISAEAKFENLMQLVKRYSDPVCQSQIRLADNVVTSNLDNGVCLATMQKPANGMVVVSVSIAQAGYAYASQTQRQIPTFVADTLVAGTSEFNKDEIQQKLVRMAAKLHVSCREKHVEISASVGLEELPEFMQLLQALLRNPTFPEEELNLVKARIASSLKMIMNSSKHMARAGLFSKLYTPQSVLHPVPIPQYASELLETESVDLVAFHKSHYAPQRTRIALVGDISHEKARKLVDDNFGDWQPVDTNADKALVVVAEPISESDNSVEFHMPGKENTHVLFGHVIEFNRQDENFFAGILSNEFLGGDNFSGLLGKAVRGTGEESQESNGITYGISSSFEGLVFGRPVWLIRADVNPASVTDLNERVFQVLVEYKETGIKPHELARLKMARAWRHVQMLDSASAIARKLSKPGFNPDKVDNVPQQIEAVTVEQIHEFNQKNINPDALVMAVAGDLSVEQRFA